MRRTGRVVAAVLVAAVGLVGCTTDDGLTPTVAEIPTTTDPDLASDLIPPTPPPAPAEVVAALDAAARGTDVCALLAAIDVAAPDRDDPNGAVEVYRALAEATAQFEASAPEDLRPAWKVLVASTEEAAVALADHNGNLDDPEVEAALTNDAMVGAAETLEGYRHRSCPPPPTT